MSLKINITDTTALLQRIAEVLSSQSSDAISFTVVPNHPQSAADFSNHQGVVVLKSLGVTPNPVIDCYDTVMMQAACWGSAEPVATYLARTVAVVLRQIAPDMIPMPGQYLMANLRVSQISGGSIVPDSGLWYVVVTFQGRVGMPR